AETAAARNDSQALYDLIRQLRGRAVTRGQHGGTQQPDNPVMEAQAWKEHFRRIQDGTQPVHDRIWANVVERADRATWMDEKPNQAEIQKAIKTMKLGKAPGIDGVTVEALRWAPDEMHHQLCTIIQTMWMDATSTQLGQEAHDWPEAWKTAIIVPLWKQKQPRSDKNNWRGVTLLSVGGKVVARIVANRLQTHTEEFMDERQQGFRRNRGVDDVLQVSRRITEEVVSSGPTEPVIVTLYDTEKAYPRVNRLALWTLLDKWGAGTGFIRVCQALHDYTSFPVQSGAVLSDGYTAGRGLKECCPSSPPLFNVYHAAVMADYRTRRSRAAEETGAQPGIQWKTKITGQFTKRQACLNSNRQIRQDILGDIQFADDTATFAQESEAIAADSTLETTFTDWGEKLNRNKTETLRIVPAARPEKRGRDADLPDTVRHVGGYLSATATQWKDTIHRGSMAMQRARAVAKAWSLGSSKGRHSIIVPTLTAFGRSRAWTRAQVEHLQTRQNYAIQRALGLDRMAMHEYHVRNQDLHAMAQWEPIEKVLARQTLRWMGHVARMPTHRLPKIAMWGHWQDAEPGQFGPTRQQKWLQTVLKLADIPELDWFRLAQDRPTWDALIKRGLPRPGNAQCVITKRSTSVTFGPIMTVNTQHGISAGDPQWYKNGYSTSHQTSRHVFTDGSGGAADSEGAGWGVAVYTLPDGVRAIAELHGPVLTDATDQRYLGADKATNNTAELTAIAEALVWIDTEAPGPGDTALHIYYDSQCAADL
ncbi:unnamed protein product, partial [Effrenium voratum]